MKTELKNPKKAILPLVQVSLDKRLHRLLRKQADDNARTMRAEAAVIIGDHFKSKLP